jgi:hypothetical protein
MNVYKLKPHPFSTIFPSMIGSDYDYLKDGIKKFGKLRSAVIVFEGMILDGNQRIRACRELRIEPKYVEFTGTRVEALQLVWDLNAGRRHMTASQKALAVARYTMMSERGRPDKLGTGAQLTGEMAEKVGVSVRSVVNAKWFCVKVHPKKLRPLKPAKPK